MRETKFISQNKEKWEEFEKILVSDTKDPDKLSSLFIQVSDDLSYSRTYYKNRMVRLYLNNLAQQIFSSLYKNKRTQLNRFGIFWKEELPQLMWTSRKNLLTSFIIFALSVFIGVFSCHQDPEFPKLILGNSYVEMTKENIKNHDPMAVYKKMHEIDMFLGIALNNLKVSVIIFLFGILFSIGSAGCLIYNGIMVGAFQYFFYEQGLFSESALTIWMHGTLEMSAMIIAGAAGLSMGNGLVFPGTYTRIQSFMISSRRGIKILMGVVPIIILAAIIESFVTRYTDLPNVIRLCVIFFSLFFILAYFVWYPWRKSKAGFSKDIAKDTPLKPGPPFHLDTAAIQSNGELFKNVFALYRKNFSRYLYTALFCSVAYILCILIFSGKDFFSSILNLSDSNPLFRFIPFLKLYLPLIFDFDHYPYLFIYNTILFSALFFCINLFNTREIKPLPAGSNVSFASHLKKVWTSLLLAVLINLIILEQNGWAVFLLFLCLPFIFFLGAVINEKDKSIVKSSLGRMFTLATTDLWKFMGLFYLLALVGMMFFLVIDTSFVSTYFELLSWNFVMTASTYNLMFNIFITWCFVLGFGLVLPLLVTGMSLLYYSLDEIRFATALRARIGKIGKIKDV
jgi:uncharacterized membrane protein SpoIIM required for sporulation